MRLEDKIGKRSKTADIQRKLLVFFIMLIFAFVMAGCNKSGGDSEAGSNTNNNFAFEGDQNSQAPNSSTSSTESAGASSDSSSQGLTSQEVLNALPTAIPPNNGRANIPSNIQVENTGQGTQPSTIPAFDSSSVDSNAPAQTTSQNSINGSGSGSGDGAIMRPERLLIYLNSDGTTGTPDSGTLNASIVGGSGSLVWKSADPQIASVTGNGNTATVTGIKEGETIVTATAGNVTAVAKVKVMDRTPSFFDVDECQIYLAGEYSSDRCDELIAKVNEVRKAYNIPECTKNTSLCKVADIRAKEIAWFFANIRPDLSSFNTVAPQFYKAESIAAVPKSASPNEAMAGLQNYTTTRADIMNENYTSIGASYYTWNDLSYIVLSFGY
ncbi:MAG: hypothetical protein K6B28_04005 [Lachnospiraceae bacterium]|nr:hypothetical protein [Lachnospiraceae bacterium]